MEGSKGKERKMGEEDLTLSLWKKWNTQGLIPGPDETEAAFKERVAFCQSLEQNLSQKVGTDLPFGREDQASQNLLQEVLPLTQELYGISPDWVPLFFSNYQLAPWHGGCAWIFQLDKQTPTAAFLQLRARFRVSPTYLGIYDRQELICHELAHIGRMVYQESQFEEILAYQTSASKWRRWFGPIIQSSKESLFFILILGVMILADLAIVSLNHSSTTLIAWWTKLIPFFLILFALSRLIYRHQVVKKCLANLETLYSEPKIARHLLYRLRDREIKQFSHSSPLTIKDYIEKAEKLSFRWEFLKALYPYSLSYIRKDLEN